MRPVPDGNAAGKRSGFTIIELMMALALVALASAMIYITFISVTRAWRNGMELADDLHHGDYILDQLALGLRSAYFPEAGGEASDYGFWLEDNGSGENAQDAISWVKSGYALLSTNSSLAAGVHRVRFSIENDDDGDPAPAVRYWRFYTSEKDFDPMELEPVFLSKRVVGFNCRVATNLPDSAGSQEWEWEDTWEDENTNRLPRAVELTAYLSPLEKDGPPIEVRRCVEIPVWKLSYERGAPASPAPAATPAIRSIPNVSPGSPNVPRGAPDSSRGALKLSPGQPDSGPRMQTPPGQREVNP